MQRYCNGKYPVFIYLPGPSLAEVIPYRKILGSLGVLPTSLNRFTILEKRLGFEFSVVYISSLKRMGEMLNDVDQFLSRKRINLLVTNQRCFQTYKDRLWNENCPAKILVSDIGFDPVKWYNSLTALILVLTSLGFEKFYLFGCDGEIPKGEKVYYAQDDIPILHNENFLMRRQTIVADTLQMNKEFWKTFEQFGLTYKGITIKNVRTGTKSAVTCFPEIDITQAIDEVTR